MGNILVLTCILFHIFQWNSKRIFSNWRKYFLRNCCVRSCSATIYHFMMIFIVFTILLSYCVCFWSISSTENHYSSFRSYAQHAAVKPFENVQYVKCHTHTRIAHTNSSYTYAFDSHTTTKTIFYWNLIWPFTEDKVHEANSVPLIFFSSAAIQSNALDIIYTSIEEECFFRLILSIKIALHYIGGHVACAICMCVVSAPGCANWERKFTHMK